MRTGMDPRSVRRVRSFMKATKRTPAFSRQLRLNHTTLHPMPGGVRAPTPGPPPQFHFSFHAGGKKRWYLGGQLVLLLPRSPTIQGAIKSKLATRNTTRKTKSVIPIKCHKKSMELVKKNPFALCEVGGTVMGWRLGL